MTATKLTPETLAALPVGTKVRVFFKYHLKRGYFSKVGTIADRRVAEGPKGKFEFIAIQFNRSYTAGGINSLFTDGWVETL